MAVYVPTNHLYLGDVIVYPREQRVLSGPDGRRRIRIFLTGGMVVCPDRIRGEAWTTPQRRRTHVEPRTGQRRAVTQSSRQIKRSSQLMNASLNDGDGCSRRGALLPAAYARLQWRSSRKRRHEQAQRPRAGKPPSCCRRWIWWTSAATTAARCSCGPRRLAARAWFSVSSSSRSSRTCRCTGRCARSPS